MRSASMLYALGKAPTSHEVYLARLAKRISKGNFSEVKKPPRPKRKRAPRIDYEVYLASKAWAAFRKGIFDKRGRVCHQCRTVNGEMHLHHKTYKNIGHEKPGDVEILCPACHAKRHPGKPAFHASRK